MKDCPECKNPLGILTATVLTARQGEAPTECRNCGLYLTNTWWAELASLIVLAMIAFDMLRADSFVSSLPVPAILTAVVGYIVARYIFCSPRPYSGSKRWCPRCHKENAIHDWTDDPTCVECEYKLRPGVRVEKSN